MNRLAALLLFAALYLIVTGTAAAESQRPFNAVPETGGALRTTYSLDSLYIHGSGGSSDQLFSTNETISVVAWLANTGGSWHATSPVDEFIIIPNTDNPPTADSADVNDYFSYQMGDVSNVSISDSNRKLSFEVDAPSSWVAGDSTFTVYLDGKCTGLHQADVSETYISAAGATLLHGGTEALPAGFSFGDIEADTSEPVFVDEACFATSLTTIRLEFNEAVVENGGDCGANFEVSGGGIISGPILGTSLSESSPTVWNLTLASPLPNRNWEGTITYDRDNTTNTLTDAGGNEVADNESATTTTENIAPANPVMVSPSNTADLSAPTLNWSGTADNATVDPSIATVSLQGSTNGFAWTTLSTDNVTTDSNYSGSLTIGTEYSYYRLIASDDKSNEAASASSTNFQNVQRINLSGSVVQVPGDYEDEISLELVDAYGNREASTVTVSLTKVSGDGTVTFRETPGGSNVTSIDVVADSTASFYMGASAVGIHEIRAATAPLLADTLSCTINAGTASQLLVRLPGQSFVDGTGITGTPTTWSAGGGIDFRLYIVDSNNFVVEETGTRTINFSSTAINSPRNFAPRIDGVINTSWTARSIDFTDGVSELLAAIFYDVSGGTITAADPDGSPALAGVESSTQTINYREADNLVIVVDNSVSESATNWTGTNTVTVRDFYGNTRTDFDASSNNVTMTSSGGTLEIASRGDAVLDQAGDFTSGVADLTTLGIKLTASSGTYTINGTIAGVTMDAPNTTDTKEVDVNAPTLSSASPAWLTHVNAEADSPGYMLQANVDENGEVLKVYWAFDNDSSTTSGWAALDSSDVTTAGGLFQAFISGSVMHSMGQGYDYMFWWAGGTDAQGNPVEGAPLVDSKLIYVVNPTLTVLGVDVGGGFEPNSTNNELTQLQLTAEMPGATIAVSRIDFAKTSTSNATTAHISGFKLWRDVNTNGIYDSGTDVQLGSTATGTVNPSFTGLGESVISGTTTYLLLTVDISPSATVAQTIGMELTSDNVFVLQDNVDDVYPSGGSWPQPAAAADYTLPVEISVFSAEPDFGSNHLAWRTESEQNSLGFVVWRAPALQAGAMPRLDQFSAMADWNLNPELLGQENSSSAADYSYTDREVEAGQLYCYRLESVDLDGSREFHEQALFVESMDRPVDYALEGNVPNPFNPVTAIRFALPVNERVELSVFNLMGEKVRTLVAGELAWGRHEVMWDGTNEAGMQVASGTYVYRLHSQGFSEARKMLLLK